MNLNTQSVELTEADWIEKANSGDADAFAHLLENYKRAVYNLCYRMLGNPNDAEDAAQETFLRAYRALHRYDKNRKFSTWILSIATHYCIDQLRKRRLFMISLDATPYLELPDKTNGPEGALVVDERQREVQQLLSSLRPKDRAAIVMRYWYDFSYNEIAEALSMTNSAVKSRLHRARRALAQTWAAEQGALAVSAQGTPYEAQTI